MTRSDSNGTLLRVSEAGMTLALQGAPDCHVSVGDLFAALRHVTEAGIWHTLVLGKQGSQWTKRLTPLYRQFTATVPGPSSLLMRFDATNGIRPEPHEVCELIARFRLAIIHYFSHPEE